MSQLDPDDGQEMSDLLLPLTPGARFWVGRDPSCDLALTSEVVSRRHACLELEGDRLTVCDSSENGTLIDGQRLHRAVRTVSRTAALTIGPYRLRVTAGGGAGQHLPGGGAGRSVAPELRRRLHRQLLDHLDLIRLDALGLDAEAMRPRVIDALEAVCSATNTRELPPAARPALVRELADEALGLGPLESLLADPRVSEIMVVDADTVYVERGGVVEATELRFTDDESVRAVIERIVTPLGRRIDESNPIVDARLRDGSRVNAIIPPLASRGPCITIRKFATRRIELDDLVALGSLSRTMASFVRATVVARKNIVIAGGTGSGKTTLLNVLSAAIPERERIVTIEDAAELQLAQRHVVTLEARPPNMEGKGEYSIRDLVKNALRMRPDRIVVGECRGGEAIDMLQAMNTGHEGSMTTTHANSPRETVARLETLCLMAGLDLPVRAIRHQIASSVHLILQQARFADGARRVTRIAEVRGVDERDEVELADIFRFERTATTAGGSFRSTGYLPSFAAELAGLDWGEP